MKLLHYSDSSGSLGNSFGKGMGRFSPHRLEKAKEFYPSDIDIKGRIKDLLLELVDKTEAKGGGLFLSGRRDFLLAKTAGSRNNLEIKKGDEARIFSGKTATRKGYSFYPFENNGMIIGYLSLYNPEKVPTELQEKFVDTYLSIIWREVSLARKKSSLEEFSERLSRKKDELQKAQQYNSNLLSITSHDLSSPLNAISGYLSLMNQCLENEANVWQLEHYRDRVESGVSDVLDIIKQLNKIGKIEQGTLVPRMVKVDLCWLARKCCRVLESRAIEKNISLEVILSDCPVYAEADITMMKRVINNLVSNAITYTGEGGVVNVEVMRKEGEACLRIIDNGMGISKADQERIFTPLVQINSPDKNNSSSGLGLYITSHFTDLMNGRLDVESTKGKGSIFTVTLPDIDLDID